VPRVTFSCGAKGLRYHALVDLGLGSIVGDYEILALLGRGAMGTVYKVRNTISDRIDAMKVLRPEASETEDIALRFAREIKLVACLDHPNIAQLRTAMRVNGQLLMIIEYVEGSALDGRIRRGGLDVRQSLHYTAQVLSALDYAHQQGVVHRDIKPQNILLTTRDVVKLTDFGIASKMGDPRQTAAGTTLGSIYYMSPEQVNAERTDGRSDVYAVGVTLYEMITGRRPIQGPNQFAVMTAHLTRIPTPPIELRPDIHPELSKIILKSLEKDPAARFQTAEEFRQAIVLLASGTAPFERLRHPSSLLPQPTRQAMVPPGSRVTSQTAVETVAQTTAPSATSLARDWDPELIDKIRRELAIYIGPMAKIIVNRAAKKARTVDELCNLAAAEISAESDRRQFMAALPR
jgi:eukaryotic-like serine/threonine-protein kinase